MLSQYNNFSHKIIQKKGIFAFLLYKVSRIEYFVFLIYLKSKKTLNKGSEK